MSEIHSLLLTDLVDSTKLSEAIGDERMATLWATHDRVARDLLPLWRGREIDKSDGMLLLFGAPTDAVGYALAYHRALAILDVPLKARAGLHVGPVVLRENNKSDVDLGAKRIEVEGIAKAMAARVMSLGLGGQTLLTSEAFEALGETSLLFRSHGHWLMKGISEPVELLEVGDANAPFTPPPDGPKAYRVVRQGDLWLPVQQIKHSLPAERDAFVGRHDVLLEMDRRLARGARLVSVLGTGGSGKSRLVTRFAWTRLGDYAGGAWFCDLSPARDVDGIVHAVSEGLDVTLGKEDPVVQLGNAIAGRRHCLVILDNFEQVSRYAEDTLGRWLSRASDACFIVTTREVLGLSGEETLALAPLAAPEAATLLLRRAEAAKWDFRPTAEDQAAIAPLVKLLDGLPLAIELAAARVRVMPLRTLLARMNERFKLLSSTGGRRERQATLRATFDWSWDLLSLSDKAALAQLSVFEGGFTLESAEAVLDQSFYDGASSPMDALQSLVDKSLAKPVTEGRFDLLVSIQEYASEQLRTQGRFHGSGPTALASAEARHCAYFAGLGGTGATAGACVEIDNLVVACRRAVVQGSADLAAGALEGAWAALALRGPFRAGVELASMVQGTPGLSPAPLARVDGILGRALSLSGQVVEAQTCLDRALAMSRKAMDRGCEGKVLIDLGGLHMNHGRAHSAQPLYEMALVAILEVGDTTLQCNALGGLGNVYQHLGRFDEARTHYEAAFTVARKSGNRRSEGSMLGNLGLLHVTQGRVDDGRANYEAALVVARALGDRQVEGNMLCNLGLLHYTQGRMPEAGAHLEAALVCARELGRPRLESVVLCNLGMVCDALRHLHEARIHYEAALTVARQLQDRLSEGQFLGYLGLNHARRAQFDAARNCLDNGEALLREVSDPVSLGLLFCSRAETEHLALAPDAARTALNEAESLAAEISVGPESELGLSLVRVRALFTNSSNECADFDQAVI